MKIHFRIDVANAEHTRFTVFINSKNCGQLCFGTERFNNFQLLIMNGLHDELDDFVVSGKGYNPDENK